MVRPAKEKVLTKLERFIPIPKLENLRCAAILASKSDAVTRDTIFRRYYRFGQDLRAGRPQDEAIALISEFLNARSGFAGITPVMLRLAPSWDLLRDDPRFQALLEEYPAEVRLR